MSSPTSCAEDVAEHLEDEKIGEVGTDLFYGRMPPAPDLCAALYNYGGSPPDKISNAHEIQGLQIKVRGSFGDSGWADAWGLANEIYEELHGLTNEDINNKTYHFIEASQSISQMGFDDLGRPMFVMNFTVIKDFD
jgi:hypothetical protein